MSNSVKRSATHILHCFECSVNFTRFFFVITHYTGLYIEINFCKLCKDIVLETGLGMTDSNFTLFWDPFCQFPAIKHNQEQP